VFLTVRAVNFPTSDARRGAHSRRWWLVAAAVALTGSLAAAGAGRTVARHASERSAQRLEDVTLEMAARAGLTIKREEDLVVTASALFTGAEPPTNVSFAEWATAVQLFARYPEVVSVGVVRSVPSASLPAFATSLAADPPAGFTGDPLVIVPSGERSTYCLTAIELSRTPRQATPPGYDHCAGSGGGSALASRDSGVPSYFLMAGASSDTLAVRVPLYAGTAVPDTFAARRSAFRGWLHVRLDPALLLSAVRGSSADVGVVLRHVDGYTPVALAAGPADGATSLPIGLGEGWAIEAFGSVDGSGILDHQHALGVFAAGVAFSVLLAALLAALATGQARAWRLVAARTGQLQHQALHDALTGLPNRALILDRMEQLLRRSRRSGTSGAVLYIDIDDFKNVNDTLGHAAGDRLLVTVASRLRNALRETDTIGRMGGDEFVVLVDGDHLDVSPELVAERLIHVMRQPFESDGAPLPLAINVSIGVVAATGDSASDVLRDADVAMYQAKTAGKNRYQVFHPEMQSEISRRIELEFDLRSAIEGGQFRLEYQPIYNLDDLELIGVEALLRWDHPRLGAIEPSEFVPILEQTGQIQAVGRWVLQEACAQMAAWHAGGAALDISVNVSGRQLDGDTIVAHVREALETSGLPPTSLIIEVTETALMQNMTATAERLQAIKALGVRIAVDDFGTGYSSLAYLQQFPIDCLKIDRRFTNAITTSPESKALIGTLVQLGRDLGLSTLAEGVETMSEMDHLRAQHVDKAQGFLLSRPVDAITFEAGLLSRPSVMSGSVGD
jgi:diguanylate cyclase (GGDEF)-like protein